MESLKEIYSIVAEMRTLKNQVECENQEMRNQLATKQWENNELDKIKKALCYEIEESSDISEKLTQKKYEMETILSCKENKVRLMENSSNIEELCDCKQKIENALRTSEAKNGDLQTNWQQTIACLQYRKQAMVCLEKKIKNFTCQLCELNQQETYLLQENEKIKQQKLECRECMAESLQKQWKIKQCLQEKEFELRLSDKLRSLENSCAQTEENIANEKCANKMMEDELKCLKQNYEALLRENCDLHQTERSAQEELREAEKCMRIYKLDVARVRNEHAQMKKSVKNLKDDICSETAVQRAKSRVYKRSQRVRRAPLSLKCRERGILCNGI